MDITKFESLTRLSSSGVQKRTLKGLCGRLKQVESRVEAAYKGLNNGLEAKFQAALSKAVDERFGPIHVELKSLRSALSRAEAEIIALRRSLPPVIVSEDLSIPAVETTDRGVQPA